MFDIDNIDIDKTRFKTYNFFEKDLDRLMTMCGNSDLTSMNFDTTPDKNSRYTNNLPDRYIYIMEAKKLLACVNQAINKCDDTTKKPYKTIIIESEINHKLKWQVAQQVGYSVSWYDVKKKSAIAQFADLFLYEQLMHNVSKIYDLHVYKKGVSKIDIP